MAGERKSLESLIDTQDPARVPVRSDSPDRGSSAESSGRSAGDMTMRSWYMPRASADHLAALVDDVHFTTRLPKHVIMRAIVTVIARHRAEVEAEATSRVGLTPTDPDA